MKISYLKLDYLNLRFVNHPYRYKIKDAIDQVMGSGKYLRGDAIKYFEKQYAQYIGTARCISCGNGLDALKLILMGEQELGRLQPGDEIIVPANTYIATILAISETGLKPVLVDASWETLQIDDSLIEKAITSKTRAIMIVHLYGRCAMTEHIAHLCEKYHLLLFEDNAQAHGCFYKRGDGRKVRTGNIGTAAAHSFYPTKNLGALGDAGAVTTNDKELAQVIRTLANYGSPEKGVFTHLGLNSRMDDFQAAVLSKKVKDLMKRNEQRVHYALCYQNSLKDMLQETGRKDFHLPNNFYLPNQEYVAHIFPVFTSQRDKFQKFLKKKGIETMIHYPIPPHKQPCYKEWNEMSFPITERICAEEISLPCYAEMSKVEVDYVIDCIKEYLEQES